MRNCKPGAISKTNLRLGEIAAMDLDLSSGVSDSAEADDILFDVQADAAVFPPADAPE